MPAPFDRMRLKRALALVERWTDEQTITGVSLAIGHRDAMLEPRSFGRQSPHDDAPRLPPDAIFLIASPTKPITALAIMRLVESGALQLNDQMSKFLPGFAAQGKRAVTLRHCLTHTSGLPDMVPDHGEMRLREAPLQEFVDRVYQTPLDFAPGRGVQYQSMGFLMLGEVVRVVTGRTLGEYLRSEVFEPLQMHDTALGMPDAWEAAHDGEPARVDRIAEIRVPDPDDPFARVWNSRYWRRLGAPWGGLLSTAGDLAKLCRHLLVDVPEGAGIIGRAALEAMTCNQLESMPDVPEAHRRCTPWGLGWQRNWPAHATSFGDLLSPAAYGHWGATGTMVWIDPARETFLVALTNEPLEAGRRRLAQLSNAVCGALR